MTFLKKAKETLILDIFNEKKILNKGS
jgi:hypothetical protein